MMQLGETIVKAIKKKLEGEIEAHKVNIQVMLENTVGVAEHPSVTQTIEEQLELIATCEDKLSVLTKHFGNF